MSNLLLVLVRGLPVPPPMSNLLEVRGNTVPLLRGVALATTAWSSASPATAVLTVGRDMPEGRKGVKESTHSETGCTQQVARKHEAVVRESPPMIRAALPGLHGM
jgi:hypothetical protein